MFRLETKIIKLAYMMVIVELNSQYTKVLML